MTGYRGCVLLCGIGSWFCALKGPKARLGVDGELNHFLLDQACEVKEEVVELFPQVQVRADEASS